MSLAALLQQTGLDDDTGANVPESPETLAAQQRALREGRQRAQMFPAGTRELALPEGSQRVETRRGVFHFNPAQITAEEIAAASAAGRENDVLGLGPASKADVMKRSAGGEPVAVVAESAPDGLEIKAALATPSTMQAAAQEMERRKAPENRVEVRPVEGVLRDRAGAKPRGGLAQLLAETEMAEPTAQPAGKTGSPGFFAGVANTARRGLAESAQTIDAASLAAGANLASDARSEPARLAEERQADPQPNPANFARYGADAARVHGIALQKWEARQAERAERLKNSGRFVDAMQAGPLPGLVSALGRRQGEIQALPQSAPMQEWERAETTGDALRVLAAHPLDVVTNLAVGGLASSGPALAAGAVGGAAGPLGTAAGAGLASFVGEYGGKVLAELQAAGVDFQKPETVMRVLNDPAALAAIRTKAIERGVPVAVINAISSGIAGRLVAAPAKSLGQRLARVGIESGAQAGLGAAGEVAGSVSAGDDVSGKAVLGATVAQLGSGLAEIATGAARERALTPRGDERPAGALARLLTETAEAEPGATPDGPAQAAAGARIDANGLDVFAPGPVKKPRFGKPADALADAINQRPADDFKADLTQLEGRDVDLVGQIARFGEETTKTGEDFPAFAERMTARFGDKVQAYLPLAWDAVSGERPVRDLVPTENPLQVESAWKRAAQWGRLFFEGSADVLRKSGVQSLADAVERHVDLSDRNLAQAWASIKPAVDKFQGLGGVVNRGRAQRAFDEFAAFYQARENGRTDEAAQILKQSAPETRALLAGVQEMFVHTGKENRRLGVRVRDRDGELRPIGYLGADNFPRLLREDVAAVLRDPSSNPKRWEEMRAELVRRGTVKDRAEAEKFVSGQVSNETSSDHFGSLEKARRARLPEDWYEYRFEKVIPRYVAQWAERAAQIEAFGQKLAETDRDAFDVALGNVKNPELRRYIEATRDHAYRVNNWNPAARKAIGNVTSATTGLFLGNPYSTLRNLVGGTAQTVNQFGVVRSINALRGAWKAIPEAEAVGALKADVADLIFHDDGSERMRKAASVALKLNGFSGVESFVRAHNFLTAKTFLRDAVGALRDDPTSRKALQASAFLRRLGLDSEQIAAENLKGPQTDRFLRGAVRESQGGYRYNQVPLFTDGPMGRFLLQFARWGTMATRFHARDVIAPAILGEEVPVRVGGKIETRRVRTLLPLLRSPLVAMGAGATTFALRKALFGMDRPDATWDEVFRALDEDQQRGVELALGHMTSDVIMGGTLGAVSDYASLLRDAAERGRFKNPLEPAAASIVKETGLLAYKLARQGSLSAQDYREFVGSLLTAYRYDSALAYRFADATGAEWSAAKRFQAEQDKRFARNAGRRFAEEAGYDMPGVTGGLPRVTENSPTYDALEDALMSGDAYQVRQFVRERIGQGQGERAQADIRRQLRTSALGRQPMKPGGRYGRDDQAAFRTWLRQRLDADDVRRIEAAQRLYFDTGRKAGLFTDGDEERYALP